MSKIKEYVPTILIFITMLTTEVMPPAPKGFFVSSIIWLMGLVLLAVLWVILEKKRIVLSLNGGNKLLIFTFGLYLIYLAISFSIGLVKSPHAVSVIRSIGPYILFLPFLFLVNLRDYKFDIHYLVIMLIICGLLQALYCIHLYYSGSLNFSSIYDVMSFRVTIRDDRCTIPFILASAIIPVHYILRVKVNFWLRWLAFLVVVISALGSIITTTRSIILSIIVGWVIYLLFFSIYHKTFFGVGKKKFWQIMLLIGVALIILFVIFNSFQSFHIMFQVLAEKAFNHNSPYYHDGRVHEEWLPALATWWNATKLSHLLGIGAGIGFLTSAGEPRTYIHNIMIYGLVYGGIFGLIAITAIYIALFVSFWKKALVTCESMYFMLSAFVCSLFFYAQLFAVHKLFSYNLIFMLLLGIAMRVSKEKLFCGKIKL